MKNNFFNFPSENSKIKIALTVNYFKNWLSENKNEQSLSYIDFFLVPVFMKQDTNQHLF